MKGIFGKLVLVCFVAASCSASKQAEDQKATAVKNLVDTRHYVFRAQSVLPMGGRSRQLTTNYDLRVYGDTLIADLPYFGRAYTAPIDPNEGGIHFTSTRFSYKISDAKKGGWNVQILPQDAKDVRELNLYISEAGYGSLQVSSNNRQSISYNGIITERNRGKKG